MVIKGKYNEIIVLQDEIEEGALLQLKTLADQEFAKDSNIVVMPDVHSGKGSVIGLTMTIKDKVVPALVGVDIGCGMELINLGNEPFSLEELDKFINENIKSGLNVNDECLQDFPLTSLRCYSSLKELTWLKNSLGTLGGGNHFIEVDIDDEGNHYLIIHSGSRNLGKQVCEIYQEKAIKANINKVFNYEEEVRKTISYFKETHQEVKINDTLKELKNKKLLLEKEFNNDLAYLENQDFEDYLFDMEIVQSFARENRKLIAKRIIEFLNIEPVDSFTCIHNYIDTKQMILRKGSIDASLDKQVIIPLNMRDGCIIAKGLGNKEYNYSAPHGAGRIMSRIASKNRITIDEFEESMKGIYSTSINLNTIDEAPQAYKNKELILKYLGYLVKDIKIIKPIYNFKHH